MAGEWETLQLRDVCVKIGSGATPRGGKEAYKGGDTSLIRSQNIYNEGFHRDGLVYIDDDQSAELRNVEVKPNDVLLNITGDSVARCCQVAADILPARVNQHVAIIRPRPDSLDARYLRYVLVSHEYQSQLLALASAGATRPALTKTMIEELSIPSPPLAEQKAIAAVLGALDDKIELNRRMNATLEAMAQALFQNWFVDATAAGLPKGWREAPFSETVDILGGGTPKTSVEEYWNGDIPWFSVVDAPQGSDVYVIDTEKKITQSGIDNSSTQILPVGTVIISARGTVGKVALVGVPMAMNQSCYGLRGKTGAKGFHTYFATQALVSTLQQHAHGSVFSTITRDTLAGVRVAAPPAPLVDEFEENVLPMMERIQNNLFESRTLATLRDTLLPKLLNGEVSVPPTK